MSKNEQGIDPDEVEFIEFAPGSGRLPRVKGPLFEDHCGHPKEAYVASYDVFTRVDGKYVHEFYDLYAFTGFGGSTNICIRFGNRGEEYYSTGPCLSYFMSSALREKSPNDIYSRALKILKEDGQFFWKPRGKDEKDTDNGATGLGEDDDS